MNTYPRLYIHHNHGMLALADVTVDAEGVAHGTVLRGGETSRLFHATSTRDYPVGERKSYPLWGRTPRPRPEVSWYDDWSAHGLRHSPTPGAFEVDVCFCG